MAEGDAADRSPGRPRAGQGVLVEELKQTASPPRAPPAAPERREVAQHPERAWSVMAGRAIMRSLGDVGCLETLAELGAAARDRARHGVYRRHEYSRTPRGGRREKGDATADSGM